MIKFFPTAILIVPMWQKELFCTTVHVVFFFSDDQYVLTAVNHSLYSNLEEVTNMLYLSQVYYVVIAIVKCLLLTGLQNNGDLFIQN